MKSLYYSGGFLFLWVGLLVLVGCSFILLGCVCCCMGWECCVIVLVISISVGSMLCWDGDVGLSRLVIWAGRLRVNLLSGLNISCNNLLLCLKSFSLLCILMMWLRGSVHMSTTIAVCHVSFS